MQFKTNVKEIWTSKIYLDTTRLSVEFLYSCVLTMLNDLEQLNLNVYPYLSLCVFSCSLSVAARLCMCKFDEVPLQPRTPLCH